MICKNCEKDYEQQYEYGQPLYNNYCTECRIDIQKHIDYPIKDEFKIGDKIELKNNWACAAKIGATGKIIGIKYRAVDLLDIEWDRNGLDKGQHDGGYKPGDFKKYER